MVGISLAGIISYVAELKEKICKLILRAGWQSARIRMEQPKTAALSAYMAFFLRGPLGLDSGRMGTPLGK